MNNDAGNEKQVDAPVSEVTLYEDRAQVRRRFKTTVPVGVQRLRIEPVSPLIADRTLVARCAVDAVSIDDIKVERQWLIGNTEQPPDAAALSQKRQQLETEIFAIEHSVACSEAQRALLRQASTLYIDSINQQLAYAQQFEPHWEQAFEDLCQHAVVLDDERAQQRRRLKALRRELERIDVQTNAQQRADHHLRAALHVDMHVQAEAEYEFEIQYMVPCALWRPMHRAHLNHDHLAFETDAAVWQATGEDWLDAKLHFSTARTTERAQPPELDDDLLRVQRRNEKRIDVAMRETTVAHTGEGVRTVQNSEQLPGVDDGGEARLLHAQSPMNVHADGRMYRVPIARFEAETEVEYVCFPEVEALVHLRSRQSNLGAQPILAGPVDLLRQSGYLGRSSVGFVAANEKFVLGWGSEDSLRVRREQREQRAHSAISGKQTIRRDITLSISNIGPDDKVFQICERIPVSEIKEVSVEIDATRSKPVQQADAQGFVTWQQSLAGHGTNEIKLAYTMTASNDVEGL